MKSGQQGRSQQRGRKGGAKTARPPLAAHRGFVPLLTLWGAGLGTIVVMVLPAAMMDKALSGTLLGTYTGVAQPLAAGTAALVLGTIMFAIAAVAHARARRKIGRPSVAESAVRQVMPINPVRDLGSRRLDDPIDAMPFASPAWRDADLDAAQPAQADIPEAPSEPAVQPAPVELDLAAFAELPGRNAVWVEDAPIEPTAAPATQSASAPPPAPPPVPGTAALSRLRAVPTEALSLPQMVERFAGALHEHRASPTARALNAAELASREAALAEALKALAALSGSANGQGSSGARPRTEPLQAALAQFQPLREASRGAA